MNEIKHDKLIFLDVETTGKEKDSEICQLAFKRGSESPIGKFFKPTIPIETEAMTVHHITKKIVENEETFVGSFIYDFLKNAFHKESYVLVAHNAEFEKQMLANCDIHPKKIICTMKVARHMDTEDRIKNYKMQYMRYHWGIEIDVGAHDALDDIIVLEHIFNKLHEDISISEMLKITAKPFLLRSLKFGKHKDLPMELVPRDYIMWLRRQDKIEGDLKYTLDHYLNK